VPTNGKIRQGTIPRVSRHKASIPPGETIIARERSHRRKGLNTPKSRFSSKGTARDSVKIAIYARARRTLMVFTVIRDELSSKE